jgi:hypothetical protein
VHPAATFVMTSPPIQMEDIKGRRILEEFIAGE